MSGFFFFRILPHFKMDAVCKTTPAGSGHAVIGDRNSNMQEGGRRPGWRMHTGVAKERASCLESIFPALARHIGLALPARIPTHLATPAHTHEERMF